MWTDGAHNTVTNFALNSELEGDKCCVKAGGRGWRGEKCGEFVIVTVGQLYLDPFQMEFSGFAELSYARSIAYARFGSFP